MTQIHTIDGREELSRLPKAPARCRRILFVTPGLPHPPVWGFAIRVSQFLRILAQRHEVALVTFQEPDEDEKARAISDLGVELHTVARLKSNERDKRMAQFRSILSSRSYQRRSLTSTVFQAKLDQLVAGGRFDLIQIESSQLAGLDFGGMTTVLDEHNIEYELLHRMYRTEGAIMRRCYNYLEYHKFRREEIASWRSASGCVLTSTREAHIVNALAPATPTMVGANAVDVQHFQPDSAEPARNMVVMTGLMRYRPNIDGALYFVREILPTILRSIPDMVFYIVGAGATEELKRLASPHVVVTDTVPDVRPYALKASVVVVPLRMGGGTRLKVLEGLAMGKAIVSTSIGCEGIDVTDGRHLIIADDPKAFADAVIRLSLDRQAASQIGATGRALVEQQYQWESVVTRLEAFYDRLLSTDVS